MSTIDDILKKSLSGSTIKTPVRTGDIESAFKASKSGIEAEGFNFQSIVPPPPAPKPKKASVINRASNWIDNLSARPEESELTADANKNFWKYLPSSFVESLPFGVGSIVKTVRDEPQLVNEVKIEDVLQGIVDTSKGVYKGLGTAALNLAMTPIKINVPGLGEITNREYNTAQRVAAGESQAQVLLEEGSGVIFDTLFLLGLAKEVVGPRHTTIGSKVEIPKDSGVKTVAKPRSFRLYEEPTAIQYVDDAVVQKMMQQNGITSAKNYNPKLPTYFKMTGKANGKIVAEVVQVKPSYWESLKTTFGTKNDPGYKYTAESLKSSGHDFDRAIESGDMPVNKIYAGKNGVLQPHVAQQTVSDLAGKLEMYRPGLGKQFQNSVDMSKPTPTNLENQALALLNQNVSGSPQPVPTVLPPAYLPPSQTNTIITKEATADVKGHAGEKAKQILPALKDAPDEHLISSARALAETSGDPDIIAKVNEAITLGEQNLKVSEEIESNIASIAEQSVQTPEKQLSQPAFEPYRPTVVRQPYNTTPMAKFVSGTFEGKPFTSDSFILEFNSTAKPPAKAEVKEAPKEESIRKIIPNLEEAETVKPVKVQSSDAGDFVQLQGESVTLDMNRRYYDYFSKKYPDAVFLAVEPYKPVVVKSGEKMVGLIMPMQLSGSGIKMTTTWEKPAPAQPTLKNPPSTTGAKKTAVTKKTPEKKESRSPVLSGGELGNLASPHGNKTIRKIIERSGEIEKGEPQVPPKDFKLSARAKEILDEFGVKIAEKSLSGRLLGVYKPLTEKVRVQALYDITTVTHEAIHAIDDQIGFSQKLIEGTGRGAEIRKRLTDIYEELYPKGNRNHPLEKRIHEGLAAFFENYFYDPASITAKYPDLVDSFIKPEGQYYNSQFTKLLDRMNELVDDYARLSPEEKIGARIRTGKEVVDKQTGFSFKQRVEYELFNRFEPLKRYARDAGVSGTWDDPLIQAFNILNKNSIITNWVKGKNTPILMKDGNFRIEEGSVADYLKMIKGEEKAFRSYLVARRVVAENNRLNELKNLDEDMRAAFEDEISKLENIIKNDDFSLQDASAVVEKYTEKFAKATDLYDQINKRLIDFSEQNGLLDAETANLYRSETGYASFRRYIDEELSSVGTIGTSSKSKVTSFKERTGSQLDIIDPIYNQITSINEIIGKGMENRLWERVANLASKDPEISQRFEKISSKPAIDAEGRISFPQEKDPGIVRVFKDGKREFYKAAPEFAAITKQLRGKEFELFSQLILVPSTIFTRLTTSANPIFAVGNITVDQFSALAQTKTGFKPVVDPAKSFKAYVSGDKGVQAYIAMGGKRQTLAAFYDLSPEDITHKLTGGETRKEKVMDFIDRRVLGILELPSNTSEIITRYSEFARAKALGKSDSEAMYMASEVTTPFQLQGNIGGRFGQDVVKSIPYFNAAIQVMYKFGRSAKSDPKRMGSVIAGLLTVGLTAAIMMYKSASEKQKRLLAEQPVRNLSNFLYFPSPDGESLIKIKIPQQMGMFSGMGYLYAAEHYGKNKATFDDYVDVISTSIPEQVQFYKPKNMLLSWLPKVIQPSIHVASNTKTFPEIGPIVPPYMVDKAPKEQYNAYTSDVAKTFGEIMGVSPTLTEYWVRNQFGVIGGLTMGKLPSDPIWIQEKDYVMTGRSYNRFYENRTLVQQQYDEIITNDKVEQKYTQEEKYTVKAEHSIYDNVSELLTEMRAINKTTDLPEEIKTAAYEVLLGIDSTENIRDIEPQIRELQSQIQSFKATQRK